MNRLFDIGYWGRALTQPIVWLGLAVDLLPVFGVIAWGWNAVPLVMLYWMENIVAGAMTIPRIVISGASFGALGLLLGVVMSAFFVFHYGLFCMVHGTFLMGFATFSSGPQALSTMPFMDLSGMFQYALSTGLHVDWMLYAIIGFQVVIFIWEFLIKGEWKNSNPMAEMFAPYGRIIVLHFGLFVGAGALIVLGQPMVGVLALIVFRAIWGVITNAGRAGVPLGFEGQWNSTVKQISNREYFEKAMRGEKVDDPNQP